MIALILAASVATAAGPSAPIAPEWQRRATGEDVAAVFPARAQRAGQSGQALVECNVTAKGIMKDCVLVGETPEGWGFGAAALRLTSRYKLKPVTSDGRSVEGGKVRIPMMFQQIGGEQRSSRLP